MLGTIEPNLLCLTEGCGYFTEIYDWLFQKIMSCILCGTRGHMQHDCPNKLCFNCNQAGHMGKECRSKKMKWYSYCGRCWMLGHISEVNLNFAELILFTISNH